MVGEIANFVISLGTNGRVVSQGSIGDAFRFNPKLKAEAERSRELERKSEHESNTAENTQEQRVKKSDGKLMVAEEVAEGHVGWPAVMLFLLAMGGAGFWFIYAVVFVLSDAATLLQTYWLG